MKVWTGFIQTEKDSRDSFLWTRSWTFKSM